MNTDYYKKQLESGQYYQDYVVEKLYDYGIPLINYSSKEFQVFIGENKAGVEIKFDKMFRKTGNFWIEVAEKTNSQNLEYVPSGIFRKDNTWLYILGDLEEIYILSKEQLQRISSQFEIIENNMKTSKGFLLPVNYKNSFLVILKILC